MADSIVSVYTKTEGGSTINYNVLFFFENPKTEKCYVLIEYRLEQGDTFLVPLLIDKYEQAQVLRYLEADSDKEVIRRFCEEKSIKTQVDFNIISNVIFEATIDVDEVKFCELRRRLEIADMLQQKQGFDIDKMVEKIDHKIVTLTFEAVNESDHVSAMEFLEACMNASKYEQWLYDKIEEVKIKIAGFTNATEFIKEVNLLRTLQAIIELLANQEKPWRQIEDTLVEFIEQLEDGNYFLKKLLGNVAIGGSLSEDERKKLYNNIIFRASKHFDYETINTAANYFYNAKEYQKSLGLYIILEDLCQKDNKKCQRLDEIINSIGCCYIGLTKFEDAYSTFNRGIMHNRDYAAIYNNWAFALAVECELIPKSSIRKTKLEDALERINQALQHNNSDVEFFSNKAAIDFKLEKFQAVIDDYNYAITITNQYQALETLIKYKIDAIIEMHYKNIKVLSIDDLLTDLGTIFNNSVGSDRYYYWSFESYQKINLSVVDKGKIFLSLLMFEHTVDKLVAALVVEDFDQGIYFYTSLASFQKVLEDVRFRQPIFCASHMNDPNEGCELQRAFSQSIKNSTIVTDLFEKGHTISPNEKRHELSMEYTFLKAFTENDDSLPMWVHYGDSGNGCCIKVSSKYFANFDISTYEQERKTLGSAHNSDQYQLYKVLYLKNGYLTEDANPEVKKLYEALIEQFTHLESLYCHMQDEVKKIVISSIQKMTSKLKYLIKNTDYHYEREMRIILRRSISDFESGNLDIQVTKSTEAAPIPKDFILSKKPLQVEEVILGPKISETDNLLPYISMRLLELNNFHEETIRITKSEIEYR